MKILNASEQNKMNSMSSLREFRGSAQKRKQKESRHKSRVTKKKRPEKNIIRLYDICVKSPIDNEPHQPQVLVYPPSVEFEVK